MSRWEERGRGWESRDIMLGTLDTSQTSPRTCWSGGLDNSTVPWDNPESSQLPSVSLQQNSPRQGKKYKITLSDRKKKKIHFCCRGQARKRNLWVLQTGAEVMAHCRA